MKSFRRKKTYGEYQVSYCPFCNKIATLKNEQGMTVCREHQRQKLEEIRCTCGNWLEARSGKFGPYFNCVKCGNINYNKGMAMKDMTTPIIVDTPKKEVVSEQRFKKETAVKERKEITISSDDVEYFD